MEPACPDDPDDPATFYPEMLNNVACQIAAHAFQERNSHPLQMYFQSLSPGNIRALLNWTDDPASWKPKVYPEDRCHYRLVAECMLRYYYYRFEPKEDDDEKDFEKLEQDFFEKKEYWSRISINGTIAIGIGVTTKKKKKRSKRIKLLK